jgi:hypothetical protein
MRPSTKVSCLPLPRCYCQCMTCTAFSDIKPTYQPKIHQGVHSGLVILLLLATLLACMDYKYLVLYLYLYIKLFPFSYHASLYKGLHSGHSPASGHSPRLYGRRIAHVAREPSPAERHHARLDRVVVCVHRPGLRIST